MPFLGRDWRSPGEQWVRTTEGWERLKMWRLKLLDNLNESVIARLLRLAATDKGMVHHTPGSQPHVFVLRCVTKEQKVQTSVAEAFTKLDMSGAVKDLRRFNYVAKLLQVLVRHKLPGLSGTAQKTLFNLLEEVLAVVMRTNNNVHVIQSLLDDVRSALEAGHYYHLGSSSLWNRHLETLTRMQNTLNHIEIKQREDDGGTMLQDLPDDCIRLILLRFTDSQDLVNAGLSNPRTGELVQERNLWRDLCLFHFDNQQIQTIMSKLKFKHLDDLSIQNWQELYRRLMKRYGMRDSYAEMLQLCQNCNALYWELHGHPCLVPNASPKSVPVSPVMCIELFTS